MDFDELLKQLDSNTITVVRQSRIEHHYTGTTWLIDSASLSLFAPDSIFFCTASRFNEIPLHFTDAMTFIVLLDTPIKPLTTDVTVASCATIGDLQTCYEHVAAEFRDLRRIIDRTYALTSLVSSGAGLKRLVNEISHIFGLPASVLDGSLSFLSYSDDFPFYAALGKESITGLIPEDAQQLLKTIGLINPRGNIDKPRVFTWSDEDGNKFTNHFVSICIDDTVIGSLSLFSQSEPLRDSRIGLLPGIAQILSIEMQKNSTYLLNKSMYYSHMLNRLLDRQFNDESIVSRFSMFGYSLKEFMHIVYIDLSHEYFDGSQVQTLAECLRLAIVNSIYVIQQDCITFLSSSDFYEDESIINTDAILDVVKSTTVTVGISSAFSKLSRARAYYGQARHAIKTGLLYRHGEHIFFFADYRIADMLSQIADQQALYSYRYPPLMFLIEKDLEHNTHLAYTLYVYLNDPTHPNEVCKKLFIHKNTLYYRLDRIKEIMAVDLKKATVIANIYLTFCVLRHQGALARFVPDLAEAIEGETDDIWHWH